MGLPPDATHGKARWPTPDPAATYKALRLGAACVRCSPLTAKRAALPEEPPGEVLWISHTLNAPGGPAPSYPAANRVAAAVGIRDQPREVPRPRRAIRKSNFPKYSHPYLPLIIGEYRWPSPVRNPQKPHPSRLGAPVYENEQPNPCCSASRKSPPLLDKPGRRGAPARIAKDKDGFKCMPVEQQGPIPASSRNGEGNSPAAGFDHSISLPLGLGGAGPSSKKRLRGLKIRDGRGGQGRREPMCGFETMPRPLPVPKPCRPCLAPHSVDEHGERKEGNEEYCVFGAANGGRTPLPKTVRGPDPTKRCRPKMKQQARLRTAQAPQPNNV